MNAEILLNPAPLLRFKSRSVLSGATRICTLVISVAGGSVMAQALYSTCGPLENAYGPFDYRTAQDQLKIVEGAHFTAPVEALIKGNAGYLGGDLDYTLRASPNHHRALLAVMRFGEKTKSSQPPNLRYSVECYFDRALRFRPDDSVARMLYATFLAKQNRIPEASSQLAQTAALAGDNAFTHYNVGLVYLDMKNYANALAQAHRAYSLGFEKAELKDRLQKLGRWKDADPLPPEKSASDSGATP